MPIIVTELKKILNYFMKDTTHTPTMRINLAQRLCVPQPKPIKKLEHMPSLRINLIQKHQRSNPSPLFPLLFRKTSKLFNEKEKKINRLVTSLKTAQAANRELRSRITDLTMENEKFATLNEYLLDKNISEEMGNALRAKREEREKFRAMGEVKILKQTQQQLIQEHNKAVNLLNEEKKQIIQDHNNLIKKIKDLEHDIQEQNQLFLQFLDSNSFTHYDERTSKIRITQLRRKIQILESNRTK